MILLCVGAMLVSGCVRSEGDDVLYNDGVLMIGKYAIAVDIADTDDARARGLSDRRTLCELCGMLFVFDEADIRQFWMKDMLFDIDIVWIAEGRVIGTVEYVSQAGQEKEILVSPSPVDHVLELPAGHAAKYGIAEGQSVRF